MPDRRRSANVWWQDLHRGAREAYRRQLAAADSASAYTVINNKLGVPARLELDHGTHTCAVAQPQNFQRCNDSVGKSTLSACHEGHVALRQA